MPKDTATDAALQSILSMPPQNDIRELLSECMGQTLTPELAARIEFAVTRRKARHMDRLLRLQEVMEGMPQIDCSLTHYFVPGVYARQIHLKKDSVVGGAVHREQNLIIVSKGVLAVATEDGAVLVRAGDTFICEPGTKNAVTVIEDATWTNVHGNPDNEQNLEVLTKRYTESTIEELGGGSRNTQLLRSGAALKELEV
jgi:quercetin dioxygenase-like cupin family protein